MLFQIEKREKIGPKENHPRKNQEKSHTKESTSGERKVKQAHRGGSRVEMTSQQHFIQILIKFTNMYA